MAARSGKPHAGDEPNENSSPAIPVRHHSQAQDGAPMTGHPLLSADPQSSRRGARGNSPASAAGAEALFRAFLAEHDRDRFAARFWLQVYRNIVAAERREGSTTPV